MDHFHAASKTQNEAPKSFPSKMDAALWAVRTLKLPVFPIFEQRPDGSCTCSRAGQLCSKKSPGKHPATANGFKDATMDESQILAWWKAQPNRSYGIHPLP